MYSRIRIPRTGGNVMLPIRTILYPAGYSEYSEYAFTDYSEHSEYAFRVACELARDYGAHLIVLHVLHTVKSPTPRGDDRQRGSSWSGNDRDSPRKELYRLKSPDPAVRLEHRLREGSPAAEILRMADEAPVRPHRDWHARADGAGRGADGQRGPGGAAAGPLPGPCREEPPGSAAPGSRCGPSTGSEGHRDRGRAGGCPGSVMR